MNVAVFGLGRSGIAVVEAVVAFGGQVTLYDEKAESDLPKPELAVEARDFGASLVLGLPLPTSLVCDYVVVNPAIDQRHPTLLKLVDSGVDIVSEIEFAYRISKAPIVAVTGTNGKSTTTAMIYTALRKVGIDAVLCGNIFGSGLPETPLTTAALNSTYEQVLIAEVSSFQLEWISTFKPWVGVITTITPDHLDRYDSFEQYAATKLRLSQSECLVVSDSVLPRVNTDHRCLLTYGKNGRNAKLTETGIEIVGAILDYSKIAVLGVHNYLNVAAAGLVTLEVLDRFSAKHPCHEASKANRSVCEEDRNGVEARRNQNITSTCTQGSGQMPEKVRDALCEFPGLAHRMELVGSRSGVRFINNSMCTNPVAVQASVESVPGRVVVLMGGVNKDLDFTPLKGFFETSIHTVFLFGKDAQEINVQMGGNHFVCSTMKEAFDAATKSAKEGDLVMLAPGCASTDQFRDFRHRGDVFREYVMEWTSSE